jgi:hypothetical protein
VAADPPLLAIPASFTHNSSKWALWGFLGEFMQMVQLRSVLFGLMLAVALSVSLWSQPGMAYTPEQEQACTGDAFRLCSSEIPNVDRVTACMVRNRSQLSPPCRAQFRSGPERDEVAAAPAGRPMAIRPLPHKSTKARKTRKPAKPKAN